MVLLCGRVSQTPRLHFNLSFLEPLFPLSGCMSFSSLLTAAVGITTLITGSVVEVEFGLAGFIQGRRLCQDRLCKHSVLVQSALSYFMSRKSCMDE